MCTNLLNEYGERKRKRYDPVTWHQTLHDQNNYQEQSSDTRHHQNARLHNDCGPTYNWCG